MNNNEMYSKEDSAIVYQSKLKEIKDLIIKAKSIGLNVNLIEKKVNTIEEDVEKKVNDDSIEEYNKSITEAAQSMSHDSLAYKYEVAIKRINETIRVLNIEYNDYYKIEQACKNIEKSLKDILNEKPGVNIDNVIDASIIALKELRESTTINYEVEKNIVNRIYRLIYEIMKIELVYTGERRLLDTIKKDETNSMFITELLENELNAVNDDDANNIANLLRSKGMNPRLILDERLIKLVAIINNSKMLEEIKGKYVLNREQLNKLDEELENKQDRCSTTKREFNAVEEEYTNLKRKTRIARFRAVLDALVLALCFTGGYKLADKFGKTKEYYTYTNTYTTETGTTVPEEGYTRGKDDSVIIIEETPWSSPGYFRDGEYERNIYQYTVPENNIGDYNKPEEFLTEDLRGIIECTSTDTETSKDIPEDFGYGQNQYTVIKQTKDLDTYHYARDYLLFALIIVGTFGSTLVVELIYLKIIGNNKYSVLRKRKKLAYKNKKDLKNELESISNQIEKLTKDRDNLEKETESQAQLIEAATNENEETFSDDISQTGAAQQMRKI